jgi:hypothetical protein
MTISKEGKNTRQLTWSSGDSFDIHSMRPPAKEAVLAGRLLLLAAALGLAAAPLEPGVVGRSGVTPI